MALVVFQHSPTEPALKLGEVLQAHGHRLRTVKLFAGDPVPVEPMPGLTIPTSTLKLTGADGHIRPLDEIEREVIRYAISHYRGQMSEVARRLKFGRSTLYRKLEGLGLREDGDHGVDSGNPRWVR